jgi:hypothetical protein
MKRTGLLAAAEYASALTIRSKSNKAVFFSRCGDKDQCPLALAAL